MFEFKNKELENLRIDCLASESFYSENYGYMMKWETKKLKDMGRTASLQQPRHKMPSKVYFKTMMNKMNGKYVGINIWAIK